jgi:predicted DNA-binding transcriptional regulator AlpA
MSNPNETPQLDPERFLPLPQVARHLQISVPCLRERLRLKNIPRRKLGKNLYVRVIDVEASMQTVQE